MRLNQNQLCRSFERICRYQMQQRPKELDLRPSEVAVLWTIEQSPNQCMYPSEISKKMGIQRPSLTPLLRELETKRLIERRNDPVDGRRCLIGLTEYFGEERNHIYERQNAQFSQLLTVLTEEEYEILFRLMEKLEREIDTIESARQEETVG